MALELKDDWRTRLRVASDRQGEFVGIDSLIGNDEIEIELIAASENKFRPVFLGTNDKVDEGQETTADGQNLELLEQTILRSLQ